MHTQLSLIKDDITKLSVDVIVNAANSSLSGGGGVDGAIHRAGGKEILEECMQLIKLQGPCKTGDVVITTAGKLLAKKVIHTIGPVWNGGTKNESQLLANCYFNSLQLAASESFKTIAFPNISTGVYGYPKKAAATIAANTVKKFIEEYPDTFHEIIFVCFDDENYFLYQQQLA